MTAPGVPGDMVPPAPEEPKPKGKKKVKPFMTGVTWSTMRMHFVHGPALDFVVPTDVAESLFQGFLDGDSEVIGFQHSMGNVAFTTGTVMMIDVQDMKGQA